MDRGCINFACPGMAFEKQLLEPNTGLDIVNDNEKCTTITKAGSLETGDATLTGILMALVAGFFGVLEETVRRKNASNAVVI